MALHLPGSIRPHPMAKPANILDCTFVGILRNLVIGDERVEFREGQAQGVLAFSVRKA